MAIKSKHLINFMREVGTGDNSARNSSAPRHPRAGLLRLIEVCKFNGPVSKIAFIVWNGLRHNLWARLVRLMGLYDGGGDGREVGVYMRNSGKHGDEFSPEHHVPSQQEQAGARHIARTRSDPEEGRSDRQDSCDRGHSAVSEQGSG